MRFCLRLPKITADQTFCLLSANFIHKNRQNVTEFSRSDRENLFANFNLNYVGTKSHKIYDRHLAQLITLNMNGCEEGYIAHFFGSFLMGRKNSLNKHLHTRMCAPLLEPAK